MVLDCYQNILTFCWQWTSLNGTSLNEDEFTEVKKSQLYKWGNFQPFPKISLKNFFCVLSADFCITFSAKLTLFRKKKDIFFIFCRIFCIYDLKILLLRCSILFLQASHFFRKFIKISKLLTEEYLTDLYFSMVF